MLRKAVNLGVAGIALTVLDSKDRVVRNADVGGDPTKLADSALQLADNRIEKVCVSHGPHLRAFLP